MRHLIIIIATLLLIACEQTPLKTQATDKPIILVSGATGKQGGAVARELLSRGYHVRGLTRDPGSDRSQALATLGAEMVKGDFNDKDSLLQAMQGAYGAFSVQNFWLVDFDTEVEQGRTFANAAKDSGIQHLIYTSVGSADHATGIPHFDSKYLIEQHILSLDIPYTIVRPVAFIDNWENDREDVSRGIWATPYSINKSGQWVAVQDIGRFVAEAFDNPDDWLGRAQDIASIEHTVEEVMAIFERVTGVKQN
jgi:uncharacterized protein YbjT (DUF2867 family)